MPKNKTTTHTVRELVELLREKNHNPYSLSTEEMQKFVLFLKQNYLKNETVEEVVDDLEYLIKHEPY